MISFNATQKTALAQGLFHRLVLEYVTCVFRFLSAEEAETKKQALLEAWVQNHIFKIKLTGSSLESLPEIVHTKDGSAVVRTLLVRGNAKVCLSSPELNSSADVQDRKQILQHLRKHVEAMCKDADAQLVLFTAFDCVE
jgi:pumilio family protein 6